MQCYPDLHQCILSTEEEVLATNTCHWYHVQLYAAVNITAGITRNHCCPELSEAGSWYDVHITQLPHPISGK